MLYKEVSDKTKPTIILLHGGGLSNWSLTGITELWKADYHILTPIIDGHGEDGQETFISIQDSAQKLIAYIDKHYGGKVFALCELSLGAQIVTEILSEREQIAQYAVLESALVMPIKGTTALTVPTYTLFYGLIKQKCRQKPYPYPTLCFHPIMQTALR